MTEPAPIGGGAIDPTPTPEPAPEPTVQAVAETTTPEAPAAGTAKSDQRRGRPRSAATLERDQRVYELIKEHPMTREQIADALTMQPNTVYLSLWRLHKSGKIERTVDGTVRNLWKVVESP